MKKKEWKLYAQYLQSTVDELMQTVDDLRVALADEQEAHGECQAGREALAMKVDYLEGLKPYSAARNSDLIRRNVSLSNRLAAISDIVNNGEN